MTTFDQRERAFENKFVQDESLLFTAMAWRNKRLALWAAERMRLPEPEALEYAARLLRIGAAQGDEGVFATIRDDLEHARAPISDHRLRRQMDELLTQAKAAVSARA